MGIGVKFSNMGSKIDVKIKDEDSCAKVDSNSAVYIRGEDGEDGATFYPEMSEDGILSWTNDKELENPEPVNIKGPPGDQGTQGLQGPAGKDGYTPVKGKDYFTKEEIADIARAASDLVEVPETAKDAVLYIEQELTDEQRAQARANIDKYQWNWVEVGDFYPITIADGSIISGYDWDFNSALTLDSVSNTNFKCLEMIASNARYLIDTPMYSSYYIEPIINDYEHICSSGFVSNKNSVITIAVKNPESHSFDGDLQLYMQIDRVNYGTNTHCITVLYGKRQGSVLYNATTKEFTDMLKSPCVASGFEQNGYAADAKAVGDALALKIDKSDIATDDEILEMLAQEDMLPVVADSDGALLSDENENILLW